MDKEIIKQFYNQTKFHRFGDFLKEIESESESNKDIVKGLGEGVERSITASTRESVISKPDSRD